MSADVYLFDAGRVSSEARTLAAEQDEAAPDEPIPYLSRNFDANWTYNLSPMQAEALGGCTIHEGQPDVFLLRARIVLVLEAFDADPDRFRALNPANGWGDFDAHRADLKRLLSWIDTRHDLGDVEVGYWL